MQSLKPHTALLVVCLLGQKLGDDVSLSQLNAVSTLFSYGKVFHKTFFHQNPGLFFAISLLSSQWCHVRGLSCPLPCVLRPPLGRCLTLVLWLFLVNVGVGVRVQGGGFLSLPIPRPVWGRWLETWICWISGLDLLAPEGKTHESLFFFDIH